MLASKTAKGQRSEVESEASRQRAHFAPGVRETSSGRKPSFRLLESALQQTGQRDEKYEEKQEKSRPRSDKIMSMVVNFLAASPQGQEELLQRCADHHQLRLGRNGSTAPAPRSYQQR